MPERRLGQLLELKPEVAGERLDHARIAGGVVVLLQHFQHDHFRPPVAAGAALDAGLIGWGRFERDRAEISILALIGEGPFDPLVGLGQEGIVLEQVCQWEEAIDPVGSAFPSVAVTAEPTVAWADHLGVEGIEVSGHTVGHRLQLMPEPASCLDSAQGQFGIRLWSQRLTIWSVTGCAHSFPTPCEQPAGVPGQNHHCKSLSHRPAFLACSIGFREVANCNTGPSEKVAAFPT